MAFSVSMSVFVTVQLPLQPLSLCPHDCHSIFMSLVYSLYIDCQFMLNCKSPLVCLSSHLMLRFCAFHLFTKLSVCLFFLLICLPTQHIMHINSSVTCGRISVVKPKHLASYSNDDITAQVQLDYLAYMEEQGKKL